MGAVANFVQDVGDVVTGAVSTVGDAVQDVGNFVIEEVAKPIAETVQKTVEAAMEDPIGTAVKVAAYSTGNPLLIAAANTTVALANGADMDQALESGAKGYVAGSIAQGVGDYVAPQAAEYFGPDNPFAASAATNAAANVSSAVALGQDPTMALLGSGITSSAAEIAKNIPGFDQLSKAQQRAAISVISTTIQGRDPSQALINEAIAGGIDAANKAINTPDIDPNAGYHDPVYDAPASEPATVERLNQELFPETIPPAETSPVPEQPSISNLFETALPPLSDVPPPAQSSEAPALPAAEPATQTPPEEPPAAQAPDTSTLEDLYKMIGLDPNSIPKAFPAAEDPFATFPDLTGQDSLDYYSLIGINPDSIAPATPAEGDPLAYLDQTSPGKSAGDIFKSLIPGNVGQALQNTSIPSLVQDAAAIGLPAAAIASLLDQNGNPKSEADVAATAFNWNPAPWQAPVDGSAYGYAQLNPTYAANGGLMSLAQGGISTLGGYSDGGRLLKGPGDGMSDHIPAMIGAKQPARLADGEFVVPADVVSHLGNGSTEAGANVLYKMMDKVRRARTGNPKQGKQINPNKFIPS